MKKYENVTCIQRKNRTVKNDPSVEISRKDLTTIVNIFKYLKENIVTVDEQVNKILKKLRLYKNIQMGILEMKKYTKNEKLLDSLTAYWRWQ